MKNKKEVLKIYKIILLFFSMVCAGFLFFSFIQGAVVAVISGTIIGVLLKKYYIALPISILFYMPFYWVIYDTKPTIWIGMLFIISVTAVIIYYVLKSKTEETKMTATGKKRVIFQIAGIVLITLISVYLAVVNALVSAALEPDFISRFQIYEDLTDKGYSEMVHSNDIVDNARIIREELNEWYANLTDEQYFKTSYMLGKYKQTAGIFMQQEYSDKWALVVHGYTGVKEEMYSYVMWYYKQGYNVIAPDLRNQGESDGDFIGMGYTDQYDCMHWLEYILDKDDNATIVLHGQSMGAATVLMMTGQDLPDNVIACIADCSYTTAYEMFGDKAKEWFGIPSFPFVDSVRFWLMFRGGYDILKASPIDAVTKSTTNTLFIHGTNDKMIDCSMVYRLYDAETAYKDILVVEGAGHVQARTKNPEKYYGKILEFILASE